MRRLPTRTAPYSCVALVVVAASLASWSGRASAGAYVFAGDTNGIDVVTHPTGYTGSGTSLSIDVCIDPTSANAADMVPSVQNAIATWNAQVATTANLLSGAGSGVPGGSVDFETVVVHELGHCIGLAHPNLASESLLPTAQQDGTKTTMGPDGAFDPGAGVDGIEGSSDDQRDDDVNLNWFQQGVNNPFQMPGTTDSTTYSRNVADLPGAHSFAANADRQVGSALGFSDTECVMQQGSVSGENQRALGHEDVAAIRYAMTGVDELAGTSDDYTYTLTYGGLATGCDINVDFDASETGFAVCFIGGSFITSDHVRITSANIFFNPNFSWFFADLCGNGIIESGETCDDDNATPGDGCNASCAVEVGFLCSGEPSSCSEICGDGLVVGSETCDDGGTTPGDGCSASCAVEAGYQCAGQPSICGGICGDGLIRGAEACDDGGTTPGDGCDAFCAIEAGYQCGGEPSICSEICGDGIVAGSETCDDGGTTPGDGCDASCMIEAGYQCSGAPSMCAGICGDGLIRGSEGCDDGGTIPGDGCDATCTIEGGFTCVGEPSLCAGICGDGLVRGAEGCDDGGTIPGDGCDGLCSVEVGYACGGEPSSCDGICGDGLVRGTEGCDDGGTTPGDGCSAVCVVEPGFQCTGEPSTCNANSVPAMSSRARGFWMLAVLAVAGLMIGAVGRRGAEVGK